MSLNKDDIILGGIYWLGRPDNYIAGLEQGSFNHPCAVVDLQDGSNGDDSDELSVFVCIVRATKSLYGS